MTKVTIINGVHAIVVDDEVVILEAASSYGGKPTPKGYARLIEGKPCNCTVAWVLENGNCPCAPEDNSNPVCKACQEGA